MEQKKTGAQPTLFGARLRSLRRQNRLTQQAVADRLNIHRTTYTKYETGGVTPDQQGLLCLAELFGVTVDYLLGRETVPADHLSVADGTQVTLNLTAQEKALLQTFRQLKPAAQVALLQQARETVARQRRLR